MTGRGFIAGALAIVLAAGGAQAHKPSHIKILASLCVHAQCTQGYGLGAFGGLSMDANGNFFGFSGSGGVYGSGTAFELSREPGKTKWKYQTIYNFCEDCGEIGAGPGSQPPVIDTAGGIYGTMRDGGAMGYGAFFKLSPPAKGKQWDLTILYSFCTKDSACHDGGQPGAPLTYQGASSGALYDGVSPLYGANEFGGTRGRGVVFSLTPRFGRWREHVLYPLCPQGGTACIPSYGGEFTLDGGGNLIGAGSSGYLDPGFLYRLSPNPGGKFWTETVLYRFCSQANCADGHGPGPVVQDGLGNLYGVTFYGGSTQCGSTLGCGVVFKLAPDNSETVLHTFCTHGKCADGWFPDSKLLLDASGALYGTTEVGGHEGGTAPPDGAGVVFKLDGSAYHALWTFCLSSGCPDGKFPVGSLTADASGNLLGLTEEGGAENDGTIFRLNQ